MAQRRKIRELALQALFAEEIGKGDWEHILTTFIQPKLKENKEGKAFGEKLFLRTLNNKAELDDIIKKHINNWRIERLNVMDKVILRMALCEFMFFDSIPTKVTINEAIEIAKRFSTKKSGNFINGILDAALNQLTKDGKIEKTGRGLIESSVKN